jgi:hypothetical protein
MRIKFEVQIINNNGEVQTIQYKTLREICANHNVEYHHARSLYLESRPDSKKKYLHTYLKDISKRIKIYDNPSLSIS